MKIVCSEIPDVKLVEPVRHGDARGWFSETYRADLLAAAGIGDVFIQDNQSFSAAPFTVRGLHVQTPPAVQAKLIRVLSGSILDVAVDLRRTSPSFGRHVAVRLDAIEGHQLYVPVGFAHGFCTLEPDTAVAYKVAGAVYTPGCDAAIAFDDPNLAIRWPVGRAEAGLSARDAAAPAFASFASPF